MRKIEISHEVPIKLLEDSLEFNDYQYCLVHLLEKYPKYLKHFEKCRGLGIKILLDNSLFELGEAFSGEQFAKWIRHLQPDQYVIPDAFGDLPKTIKNAIDWFDSSYKHEFSHLQSIGVIQGQTYEELKACYDTLNQLEVDVIAITFASDYYTSQNPHIDKNQARMFGRITLINRLLNDGVINTDKPHHLLGAGLPQEFMFYQDSPFDFITQLDTSSPVIHGMHGIQYKEGGLIYKEESKLADEVDIFLINFEQTKLIQSNIEKFRKLVEG